MTEASILIVANDDSTTSLEECLTGLGYTVCARVSSAQQALDEAAARGPDLALIDLGLQGDDDAVEAADRIGGDDVPVVYLTNGAEEDPLQRTATTRPFGYVVKPFNQRQLHLSIQNALSLHQSERRHRETERALEQTAEQRREEAHVLERVFDSLSAGVIAADADGEYLVYNSSAQRMLGTYLPGTGQSRESRLHELFRVDRVTPFPRAELPLSRAVSGESTDDVEVFSYNQGLTEGRLLRVSGRPIKSNGSGVTGGVIVFHDATRTREAEASLEQNVSELSDQKYLMEYVLDNINDGVLVSDATNRIVYMNRSARHIYGSDVLDVNVSERANAYGLFYPDGRTQVPVHRLPLVRAIGGEDTEHMELFVRNRNNPGGTAIRVRARTLRDDAGGRVRAGVAVVHDLTGHRETRAPDVPDGRTTPAEAAGDGNAVSPGVAGNGGSESTPENVLDKLRSRAELMESICDNISEGLIVADPQGEVVFGNKVAERIFGRWLVAPDPGDWASTYGVFFPDVKTPVPFEQLPLVRALRGETTDEMELFIRNGKNPTGTYINCRALPMFGNDGTEVIAGIIIFRDLTGDRETAAKLGQTAEELQRQTQLMKAVFESMAEGVIVADTAGRLLFMNPPAEETFHESGTFQVDPVERAKTYGIYLPDRKTPHQPEDLPLQRAIRGEAVNDVELFVRRQKNPEGAYLSVSGRPLEVDESGTRGGVVVFRDVTEIKRTEAELKQTVDELREKTQLLETVLDSLSDGVIVASPSGQLLLANPSTQRMFGMDIQDVSHDQWTETYGIFHPDRKTPAPFDQTPIWRASQGEETGESEFFIRNENTEGTHISASARPMRRGDEIMGAVGIIRDVTEQRKTEARLAQTLREAQDQAHLLETVFNSISDGIVVADADGEFLYMNPEAKRTFGEERRTGPWAEKPGQFYYPDRVTPIKNEDLPMPRAIFNGEAVDDEDVFIPGPTVQGGVYIRISARPLRTDSGGARRGVIIFRDVTEQVMADEALTRAFAQGRLEMVETILHNIGNAINSVTIGVDTVQRSMKESRLIHRLSALADAVKAHQGDWSDYVLNDPQGRQVAPFIIALADDLARDNADLVKTVERVGERAQHIADIVRTQKALGNSGMDRKDISLPDALSDAVKVLQESLDKRSIAVAIDCENAPQEIRVQESPFNQMLVNLVKNSIEAIDERAVSGEPAQAPRIGIRAYVKGDFLNLEVSDNGIGIDTKKSRLIFAAGYTTKKQGSGLGLHSIANFVVGSGGQIHPLSDGIGHGATMRVMLRLSSITSIEEPDYKPA